MSASRVPSLAVPGYGVRAAEWALLFLLGASAGMAATLPDFNLRIPGHAVLRSVFPMALGLALVPRRFAGSVMGCSAFTTVGGVWALGFGGIGTGATTSLALMGPFLDVALFAARRGWQFYLGFVLAGLAVNLVALIVRSGFKVFVQTGTSSRGVGEWWSQAIFTYPACGILAGLLSAIVWDLCRVVTSCSSGPCRTKLTDLTMEVMPRLGDDAVKSIAFIASLTRIRLIGCEVTEAGREHLPKLAQVPDRMGLRDDRAGKRSLTHAFIHTVSTLFCSR